MTPLMNWTAHGPGAGANGPGTPGEETPMDTVALSGLTFVRKGTGNQWFKQLVVIHGNAVVLDIASKNVTETPHGLMQVRLDGKPVSHHSLVTGRKTLPPGRTPGPSHGISSVVSKDGLIKIWVPSKELIVVQAGGLSFEVEGANADKFSGEWGRDFYHHLNVRFSHGIPAVVEPKGLFAELAGLEPMSSATEALLKDPMGEARSR